MSKKIKRFLAGFEGTANGNPATMEYALEKPVSYEVSGNLKGTINIDGTKYYLPDTYTQVEYLESSGTQYIDTGVIPDNDTVVKCKVATGLDAGFVFGSRTSSSSSDRYTFVSATDSHLYRADYYNTSLTYTMSIQTEPFTVYKNKNVCTVTLSDGTTETVTNTAGTFTGTYNMYLFACNTAGTASTSTDAKIYNCAIYDDTTLVRAYIPVKRNSDSVLGMYDLVTKTFYTNAGSGTFTAGNKYEEYEGVGEAYCQLIPTDDDDWTFTATGTEQSYGNWHLIPSSATATATWTKSTHTLTFTTANRGARLYYYQDTIALGHRYYVSGIISSDYSGTESLEMTGISGGFMNVGISVTSTPTQFHKFYAAASSTTTDTYRRNPQICPIGSTDTEHTITIQNLQLWDLTYMFGAGNEPSDYTTAKTMFSAIGIDIDTYNPRGYYVDKIPLLCTSQCNYVDLGTKTYTKTTSGDITYFYFTVSDAMEGLSTADYYCSEYTCYGLQNVPGVNNAISQWTSGGKSYSMFSLRVDAWADKTAAEIPALMSGVILYYHPSTQSTWTAPTISNIYTETQLNRVYEGGEKKIVNSLAYQYSQYGTYNQYFLAVNLEDFKTGTNVSCYIPGWTKITYPLEAPAEDYQYFTAGYSTSSAGVFLYKSSWTSAATAWADLAVNPPTAFYQLSTQSAWGTPIFDTISSTGTRTNNVGKVVFDGTESWSYGGDTGGYGFYLTKSDYALTGIKPICTHFITGSNYGYSSGDLTISLLNASSNIITVRYDAMISGQSADLFKAYLAAQYAAGTPVTVYYPLATATTSTVTCPTITNAKGTNYLEAIPSEKPSELSATYCRKYKA